MLFNSIDFAIFLPIFFFIYWFIGKENTKLQNVFILLGSYLFYAWWDWKFLFLIILSTLIDYFIGVSLSKEKKPKLRKLLLILSLCVNLGILGFFKYYNFFLDNFINVFSFFGYTFSANSLSIILPVGISFYTFQTLSYTIDVYKKQIDPTKDLIAFGAFVSFFPQLVAGPIERASNLLPQFFIKRNFSYNKAVDGLRQILWGLFKKMVIADNCATYANQIFDNYTEYSGSTLLLGAVFFAFQIYGDFSGYSDIAIGTSRLFGFNLKQNFAFPYFSRNIGEFWRRWHISLSTWFRDYLYIPLGGSKGSVSKQIRNIFIIFIVSGFWHGASWNFVIWGGLNAMYFLPLFLMRRNRSYLDTVADNSFLPSLREMLSILVTFILVTLSWVFFRSSDLEQALFIINKIFSASIFSMPLPSGKPMYLILLLFFFIGVEWFGRKNKHALETFLLAQKTHLRLGFYFIILGLMFYFSGEEQEFIYFQF